MKLFIFSLLIVLSITGCQNSSSNKKNDIHLMGYKDGVNPNSLAHVSADKQKDRLSKIELSKIDSDTKIKIAEINSGNQLLIAKVNADAQTDIAQTDSTTKIKTSQIDATTKKDDIQSSFNIVIIISLLFAFALLLFYLNSRKNRELKRKLQEDKLQHEKLLKEREYDEQRLHKMLDLVKDGKLSQEMEDEIIASLTKPKTNLLI